MRVFSMRVISSLTLTPRLKLHDVMDFVLSTVYPRAYKMRLACCRYKVNIRGMGGRASGPLAVKVRCHSAHGWLERV